MGPVAQLGGYMYALLIEDHHSSIDNLAGY